MKRYHSIFLLLLSLVCIGLLILAGCGGGSSNPDSTPASKPKLVKPIGFFTNHSWWWNSTDNSLYDYDIPGVDFDWYAAHGNADWLLSKLKPGKSAIVDTGMIIQATEDGSPYRLQANADALLDDLFFRMTPEQATSIKAFVIFDEIDIKPISQVTTDLAVQLLRSKFVSRFGYQPKILSIYSYEVFKSDQWKSFDKFDIVAFNCYPVSYGRKAFSEKCGGSSMSVPQMHDNLASRLLPSQSMAILIETSLPIEADKSLVALLNQNLIDYSAHASKDAAKIDFVIAFNWQGLYKKTEFGFLPDWSGAKDLPGLNWSSPFK